MFKFLTRWLAQRAIREEFEEELSSRIKLKLFLQPMDDEMAALFAITNKSPIEKERLLQMLSQMRKLERAKMMKEENFGLKKRSTYSKI